MAGRTGVANLPLHYGAAPRWLFERMMLLARQIALVVVEGQGAKALLGRLADPFWFQAFGCVLGFDWHSSGLTTTVCGALKEGLRGLERETGLFVAGGKGRTSRKTPHEVETFADAFGFEPQPLVYSSRMVAKVDSAALQDGYQLYHHTFIFIPDGTWAVVQQGMNTETRWARRYHWLSTEVQDLVCEPHSAICSDATGVTLNMVAVESAEARSASAQLAAEKPETVLREATLARETLDLPGRHHLTAADLRPGYLDRILLETYERQPGNFEELLALPGVGAKTIRALALISELPYGTKASTRDPARFSFAHGGKDGHPYPVDRETYDRSIELLRKAVSQAKLGSREKLEALRRLAGFGEGREGA